MPPPDAPAKSLAYLCDDRLAPFVTGAVPAWLWATDGSRIYWTNAAGLALLDERSLADLTARRFEPRRHAAARDIAGLAAVLSLSGGKQLARLRGLALGRMGRPLLCACSSLTGPEGTSAILVTAAEPVKVQMPRTADAEPADPEAAPAASPESSETAQSVTAAPVATLDDVAAALAEASVAPAADAFVAEPKAAEPEIGAAQAGAAQSAEVAAATAPAPPAALGADDDTDGQLADLAQRLVERRHPLRFVWQMDAVRRFTIASDDFIALMGPRTAVWLGRPWEEIAGALGLDPDDRIGRAFGSRDTWSGIDIAWPADSASVRLPVALSGLPVFERDRAFAGYRGFGVCRDVDAIAAAITARRTPPDVGLASVDHQEATGDQSSERASEQPIDDRPADVFAPPDDAAKVSGGSASPHETRPQLVVVPPVRNVVPFRGAGPVAADKRPALTTVERHAFHEIAKALGARAAPDASAPDLPPAPEGLDSRLRGNERSMLRPLAAPPTPLVPAEVGTQAAHDENLAGPATDAAPAAANAAPRAIPSAFAPGAATAPPATTPPQPSFATASTAPPERLVLDRMPVAVLAYRFGKLIYANRPLLEWSGFANLDEIAAAGGFDRLFPDPSIIDADEAAPDDTPRRAAALATRSGETLPVEARLFAMLWEGETALLLTLNKVAVDEKHRAAELALRSAEAETRELRSILDTATDGVIVTDAEGQVLGVNRSAEALFGYDAHELAGRAFAELFAPESQRQASDYLDGLAQSGVASLLNDGREVIGRVREGGLIPLFMTMGRTTDQPAKFCAVFRDITQWKRAEEELVNARREAEKASSEKSDFLAKISHEIRTPLNAIIGFSEVMVEQRLGPLGNDRYRDYLREIQTSSRHLLALLNDLLDLSKIEAGKLDLEFARVDLNGVTQEAVAIMQPEANRERIIIRTSLSPLLPPVVADVRSIRQIMLNLLSNSIKFTGAGGQVIVSTALTDSGEAVLRVRDTGAGMNESDIATALQPFRQLPNSGRPQTAGTGLGLPLTKALAEANRASFHIKSAIHSGTLVEIVFPATRVLAK